MVCTASDFPPTLPGLSPKPGGAKNSQPGTEAEEINRTDPTGRSLVPGNLALQGGVKPKAVRLIPEAVALPSNLPLTHHIKQEELYHHW